MPAAPEHSAFRETRFNESSIREQLLQAEQFREESFSEQLGDRIPTGRFDLVVSAVTGHRVRSTLTSNSVVIITADQYIAA